jgi:hypothetical protein
VVLPGEVRGDRGAWTRNSSESSRIESPAVSSTVSYRVISCVTGMERMLGSPVPMPYRDRGSYSSRLKNGNHIG